MNIKCCSILITHLDICRPICEEAGELFVCLGGDEIVECALDASRLKRLDPLDDAFCTFKMALPVVIQHVAHRVLNLRRYL